MRLEMKYNNTAAGVNTILIFSDEIISSVIGTTLRQIQRYEDLTYMDSKSPFSPRMKCGKERILFAAGKEVLRATKNIRWLHRTESSTPV